MAAIVLAVVVFVGDSRPTSPRAGVEASPSVASSVLALAGAEIENARAELADLLKEGTLVRPARLNWRDAYAGVRLDIPAGWLESEVSGIWRFGPADALSAYPITERVAAHQFSVTVQALQSRTYNDLVASLRAEARDKAGDAAPERFLEIHGRRTYRVSFGPVPLSSERCSQCAIVETSFAIRWSVETTLLFSISANSARAYDQWVGAALSMLDSIRESPIDPLAGALRDFMRARVAGRVAERWLTAAARKSFNDGSGYGLYSIVGNDIKDFDVESAQRTAEGVTAFDISTGFDSERIVIGPGVNYRGARSAAVVRSRVVTQEYGTS